MEVPVKRFFLLAFVLLAGVASVYAQFRFTPIDFPGGTLTTARGINNHGEIVGAYRITPPRHALLIKHGQYIPLAPNTVLDTNLSEAFKSNDRGDVVGDFIGDDGFTHGFLLSDGVVTTLDFPGASDTLAFGINESGTVVGDWDLLDANGNLLAIHGFKWKGGVLHKSTFLVPWTRPYLVSTHVAISSAGGILASLHQTNTASLARRGGIASALMFLFLERP
jgi:uncharacterized membrane protein